MLIHYIYCINHKHISFHLFIYFIINNILLYLCEPLKYILIFKHKGGTMSNKTIMLFFLLLSFCNFAAATSFNNFEKNSIMNFIELSEDKDEVKLKKESIPVLQEILDNSIKDQGFFSKDTLFKIIGVTSIGLNLVFSFKLFDLLMKNSEDVDILKQENIEALEQLKRENFKKIQSYQKKQQENIKKSTQSNILMTKRNQETIRNLTLNVDDLIQKNLEIVTSLKKSNSAINKRIGKSRISLRHELTKNINNLEKKHLEEVENAKASHTNFENQIKTVDNFAKKSHEITGQQMLRIGKMLIDRCEIDAAQQRQIESVSQRTEQLYEFGAQAWQGAAEAVKETVECLKRKRCRIHPNNFI